MCFSMIFATFPEELLFKKGFSSNCNFCSARLSDFFCILRSLKVKNTKSSSFFQNLPLSTSQDKKLDNNLEETYQTCNVTMHRYGDLAIMWLCC